MVITLRHEREPRGRRPFDVCARGSERKACLNCHLIEGHGGRRGPELTYVADKLTKSDITSRIANGGVNMPAFGATLKPQEIEDLVAFLESRKKRLASTRP